jgi:chromosome segregation ATPase
MVESAIIKTGVDQLVTLIKEKKKVSTEEAAKELGVSVDTIEGWADFLEDECIISIETRFSKVYLVERKLSRSEIDKKLGEHKIQREGFIRKLKTIFQQMHTEGEEMKKFKQEFLKAKKDLGSELEDVQKEMEKINRYDEMKKAIDEKRAAFEKRFEERLKEIDKRAGQEKKKYEAIEKEIEESEKAVAKGKGPKGAGKSLGKLKQGIKTDKETILQLVEESKKKERELMAIEKGLIEVIKNDPSFKKLNKEKMGLVQRKFKDFFSKKRKVEKLLGKIDRDKTVLEDEMCGLIKKSQAYDAMAKSGDFEGYMKQLQEEFKRVESKRNEFEKEINELKNTIKV